MMHSTISLGGDPRAGQRWLRSPRSIRWLTAIITLGLWQLGSTAFFSDSVFVAGPVAIARQIPTMITDSAVLDGLRITGAEFLLSFALAAVIGVALGAVLGATIKAFRPVRQLLQISFALPQVAIYPIFTLWLGVGFSSKVAFGVTHGIFPVVLGTMAATKLVDRSLLDSARAMGAGRITTIRKVVVPSVLPDIVTSLRLASALCLLGVLLAELMVSAGGVGALLVRLSSSFQPDRLYALVAVVCLGAILVNMTVGRVEHKLSSWRV